MSPLHLLAGIPAQPILTTTDGYGHGTTPPPGAASARADEDRPERRFRQAPGPSAKAALAALLLAGLLSAGLIAGDRAPRTAPGAAPTLAAVPVGLSDAAALTDLSAVRSQRFNGR